MWRMLCTAFLMCMCVTWACSQNVSSTRSSSSVLSPPDTMSLTVPSGTTLQVALDKEVKVKRVGQPIHGLLVEPVYAFDQEVVVQRVVLASLILGLSASSLAQEQRIARKDVPAAVLAAFTEAYPKAVIKGCSKETDKGQTVYEIESVEGKTRRNIIYSADGKLILAEETLDVSEMPPGVKAALNKKFPGAKILRAEKVTKGTVVGYEFQIEHNGKTTEVVFDSMGNELKM